MRTSEAFILGTITGAVVIWFWGREIQASVRERTREARTKAAEGLRRGDEFLQATKEHVSDALRAGEVAIRPASATREA